MSQGAPNGSLHDGQVWEIAFALDLEWFLSAYYTDDKYLEQILDLLVITFWHNIFYYSSFNSFGSLHWRYPWDYEAGRYKKSSH